MLIAEYDYDVDIAVQQEEEREIALKEGEVKGSHRKALKTAKRMKQANCNLDFIMQMTGRTEAEIEQL